MARSRQRLPKEPVETIIEALSDDTGELVEKHGYKLVTAGAIDLFPYTSHVGSIALFTKQ